MDTTRHERWLFNIVGHGTRSSRGVKMING